MSTIVSEDMDKNRLDPRRLNIPYQIKTNWHVITGAPCCGKTTIIDLLAARGYETVQETARIYLEEQFAQGRTLEEIFACPADAYAIRDRQLEVEQTLSPSRLIFLDRGLPDSLAFWPMHDRDPNEFVELCFCHRYAAVYILERLPLELDGARLDDDPFASYLDRRHTHDYTALGYNVIHVPVLPPEQRLGFILEQAGLA